MRPCRSDGCDVEVPMGRGRQYCPACKADAEARRLRDAVERTRRWRQENPERYRAMNRAHYERTAEEQRRKAREWYYANPDRVAEQRERSRARKYPRVRKYGLTLEEYRSLLAAQGDACKICRRTENGKRHNFDVDHDHETGQVRGLLCNRCNRLLSNALDDVAILTAAVAYLTEQEAAAA